MRKTSRRGAALAALACTALVASACSSSGGTTKSAKSGSGAKHYVIGWSNPQGLQPVFVTFTKALETAAKRENIDVTTLDAQANPSKQVSDIQTLITKKVDAIVVCPLQEQALTPVLTQARNAGIKIIGFDAVTPKDGKPGVVAAPYDANVDQGFALTGARRAGKFVADELQGKGNVVGIKLPVPVPTLIAFLDAYKQHVTAGNPNIRWLGTLPDATDDLAGAEKSMADAITRFHGKIDAVMSYTDTGGIGARKALDAASIKNVVIVGQQGNQIGIDAVRAGQIQGDIDVQPWMEAVVTLSVTRDVLNGKTVPKFVEMPVKFITKANVDSYVPWDQGIANIANGKLSLNVDYGKL